MPQNQGACSSDEIRRLTYRGDGGERLDRFLVEGLGDLTRSRIKRLIDAGLVAVNGGRVKAGCILHRGDVITLTIPPAPSSHLRPESIPLEIIYEDPWILVINKSAGIVVHPAPGHASGTLVNALLAHCPGIQSVGAPPRAGLVHRLDKDTSGVMVIAKDDETRRYLAGLFKARAVEKIYVVLVHGRLRQERGTICFPLGRHWRDRKRISHKTRKPRAAVTHWHVLRRLPHCTLLAVKPETGRTHQIRAHLAAIRHPVVGDSLYRMRSHPRHVQRGDGQRGLHAPPRQFLHAIRLSFLHPKTQEICVFSAPLPPDLLETLSALEVDPEEVFRAVSFSGISI